MKIDNETRYVPSRTICLKFAGQALPRFIYLFNCRYSIYPFIPKTKICFSCFRVGHFSKACKSCPRCLYCGEAAHDSSEDCARKQFPPTCVNCNGDHLATSHDCPKVLTHKMDLSLAATENISFTEALKSVGSSISSASISFADPRFDFHNFPSLPRHRSSRSPSHFLSPNSFSILSNLPSSDDSSASSKPFSSIVKNTVAPATRFQRVSRSKQSSPPSNPTSSLTLNNRPNFTPGPAFPKEHRDLLLQPHGRPVALSTEHTGIYHSSPPHPPDSNTYTTPSEAQPEDIHRFLSNPAEILQYLLVLLGGLTTPPNSNLYTNFSSPSMISWPSPYLHDLHSTPLWTQGSFSQP